ncbi:MAG: homoserine O-acetyltransferase [Planctomycetota bacterium]|jgi:homoserine O-acetyltransferase|nr:homoserine O-acetyltransferase [Planctomycetota bacterium]
MNDRDPRYDAPDSPRSVGWVEAQRVVLASGDNPFVLESGTSLAEVEVEYETYGSLNADASNAILVCHALSGDAHVAGWDARAEQDERPWRSRKPGWWDAMVGPGKFIDTDCYFVVCSNVLGSCYGTTAPASLDPDTGKPYGLRFPVVTVEDWVQLQHRLITHLGIERLHTVIGGSLGGQQALEWALAFPNLVDRCVVLAASPRLSAQGLGFNAVGRHGIMNDPAFVEGDYYDGEPPAIGLAAARMLAHITYLSEQGMDNKFGRRLRSSDKPAFGFGIEFEVESYLDYQGRSFAERFDANSYLYITRAMDYYDAAARWGDGDLGAACRRIKAATMVVSFSTDWLYTPDQCRELGATLLRVGAPVTYLNLPSPYGHDAFLVEIDMLGPLVRDFLASDQGAES